MRGDRRGGRQAGGRGRHAERLAAAVRRWHDGRRAVTSCSRWAPRACRRASWPRGCGNRWTYAGDGVAPGQIPADRLLARVPLPAHPARRRALRRRRQADRRTRCRRRCTTPGSPRSDLNAVYLPLEAPTPTTSSPSRRRCRHAAALSVTTPFKVDAACRRGRDRRRSPGASARSTRSSSATAAGSATNTDVDGLPRAARRTDAAARRARVACSAPAARRARSPSRSRDSGAHGHDLPRGGADAAREVARAGRRRVPAPWPPPPGSGTCSSTPRRSAASRRGDEPAGAARRSTADWSTTSSTTRRDDAAARRARRGLPRRSAASRCSSRRPSGSSSCGPGSGRPPGCSARPRVGRRRRPQLATRRRSYEADDVRRVRGAGAARHVRAGRARRSSPTC